MDAFRTACMVLAATALSASAPAQTNQPDAAGGESPRRPRIGVALSGGGACGIAHIGVLRVLEEHRVPVDFIAGTSMGAIIAGFYAAGLSPDEIEQAVTSIDWWDALTDATPRRDLTFRRKEEATRYLLGMEIGFRGGHIRIPSGLRAGQKFSYYLEAIALRSASVRDFDALGIPYRAVATDLEKGERVVLDQGRLPDAMRASMAVPGLFTPLFLDGRWLIDGGVVDNLPVDVVREMGADVVIAVDVGAAKPIVRETEHDILDITRQAMEVLLRPHVRDGLVKANLSIVPNLNDFSPADFQKGEGLVRAGKESAQQVAAELDSYSVSEEQFQEYLRRQRRPLPEPVQLGFVEFKGQRLVDERLMKKRIRAAPGQLFDLSTVRLDLSRLYGMGHFESVRFQLARTNDQTGLEYRVAEKPWGPDYVRFGLHLENDFEGMSTYELMMNYTRRCLNPLGAEWRNEVKLGRSMSLVSAFYQPLDFANQFFVSPSVEAKSSLDDIYDDNDRVAEYRGNLYDMRLDGGFAWREYGEFRVGLFCGAMDAEVSTGPRDMPSYRDTLVAATARLVGDTLDSPAFPRAGGRMDLQAFCPFEELGSEQSYTKFTASAIRFASRTRHTFFGLVEGGTAAGSTLPDYDQFTLGGFQSFSGYAEDQLRGSYYGKGSLGYLFQFSRLPPSLGDGLYAAFWADVGNLWQESEQASFDDLRYGATAALGADTVIGPVYLACGRADGTETSFYFSLGKSF